MIAKLCLAFGVHRVVRCDGGREFVAEVGTQSCRWLHADIVSGPADHLRGQGAVERLEGRRLELLAELGRSWPREVGRIRVFHDLDQTHNGRETITLNSGQAVKRAVRRQG